MLKKTTASKGPCYSWLIQNPPNSFTTEPTEWRKLGVQHEAVKGGTAAWLITVYGQKLSEEEQFAKELEWAQEAGKASGPAVANLSSSICQAILPSNLADPGLTEFTDIFGPHFLLVPVQFVI